MKNKKKIGYSKIIIFSIVSLLVGILLGTGLSFVLFNVEGKKIVKVDSSKYSTKFDSLYETYEILKNEYYKELDDDELIRGAINGMIDSIGDEHSMAFTDEERKNFETSLSGSYYGIGAQVTKVEEDTVVTKVFDNSPAEKTGLKIGDVISVIDGESVKGSSLEDVVSKLKSKDNKISNVIINRDGNDIEVKIEKGVIELPSVSTEMFDDHIGYIYISVFGENTDEDFAKALSSLKDLGMDKLIIDLRDNSGGYLGTVTNMISEFVDEDTVIYQIKNKDKITKYNAINKYKLDYPVVILVNENSASASEIFSSALKEQYGAKIVGTRTYGKGTVQRTKELSNGTLIKWTIEEWLTSNGNSIEKEGITPDYEIDLSEEYFNDISYEKDNQLEKALELLR